MTSTGYIYILSNPSFRRNHFKIGRSAHTPEYRAQRLSRSTSAPSPFRVEHEWKVSNIVEAERLAHATLTKYRVNMRREYFRIPLDKAIALIEKSISQYLLELTDNSSLQTHSDYREEPPESTRVSAYAFPSDGIDEIQKIVNNTRRYGAYPTSSKPIEREPKPPLFRKTYG